MPPARSSRLGRLDGVILTATKSIGNFQLTRESMIFCRVRLENLLLETPLSIATSHHHPFSRAEIERDLDFGKEKHNRNFK
jgi:hypothetical protein